MNRFSTIWVVAAGFLMAYWGIGQRRPFTFASGIV